MSHLYESMMVVVPGLAEPEREEIFQKISKKITSLGGKVTNSKIWAQERDLTFVLQSRGGEKKKYSKGMYWLINFSVDTQKIPELKEAIKLEERILRSLILQAQEPRVAQIMAEKGA